MNALLVLVLAAAAPSAPPPSVVALPGARTDGAVSVEKALQTRRSLRAPSPDALTLEQVAQLCWAAQGTTDEKGHRTAPSALATYPLELYVLAGAVGGLEPGLYRYRPATHDLAALAKGDRRAELAEKGIGQAWIARAPAIFLVTGAIARFAPRAKERAAQFQAIEAGLAAQGFFLQATALGLGSTYVGGFKPEAHALLALPAGEELLAVLPVGRRP